MRGLSLINHRCKLISLIAILFCLSPLHVVHQWCNCFIPPSPFFPLHLFWNIFYFLENSHCGHFSVPSTDTYFSSLFRRVLLQAPQHCQSLLGWESLVDNRHLITLNAHLSRCCSFSRVLAIASNIEKPTRPCWRRHYSSDTLGKN